MAELFGVTQQNISYHLSQVEESGELHLSDAYKKILLPSDKWSGEVMMYNLDVVIAVGYRVNSYEATQFRIWATQVLKEYLTKGALSAPLGLSRLSCRLLAGAPTALVGAPTST